MSSRFRLDPDLSADGLEVAGSCLAIVVSACGKRDWWSSASIMVFQSRLDLGGLPPCLGNSSIDGTWGGEHTCMVAQAVLSMDGSTITASRTFSGVGA